eukprot:scaffold351664_cov31-Attheya_sp.AAC.1
MRSVMNQRRPISLSLAIQSCFHYSKRFRQSKGSKTAAIRTTSCVGKSTENDTGLIALGSCNTQHTG